MLLVLVMPPPVGEIDTGETSDRNDAVDKITGDDREELLNGNRIPLGMVDSTL